MPFLKWWLGLWKALAKRSFQLGLRQIKTIHLNYIPVCLWNFILGYFRFIDYLLKRLKSLHGSFYLIHLCCSHCGFKGMLGMSCSIRKLAPSVVWEEALAGLHLWNSGHELASKEGFLKKEKKNKDTSNIWTRAGQGQQILWAWDGKRNSLLWWKTAWNIEKLCWVLSPKKIKQNVLIRKMEFECLQVSKGWTDIADNHLSNNLC